MPTTKKSKSEWTVGLVHGAVVDGEDRKLGEIVTVDVNLAQILKNTNRGKVIDDEYTEAHFKEEVAEIVKARESLKKGKAA